MRVTSAARDQKPTLSPPSSKHTHAPPPQHARTHTQPDTRKTRKRTQRKKKIRTNCYCYAVDRFVGSYCEPGLGGTGKGFELPVDNCTRAVDGVVADGGVVVSREDVYGKPRPSKGHYIALAIKPRSKDEASGDFHFWRLDANGVWSYKAGDTLVRNTLRNGRAITDIEKDEAARGEYTRFCAYFHVDPSKHKLVGNEVSGLSYGIGWLVGCIGWLID